MKLRLDSLELTFKKAVVRVPLADFNYFYGEMGAGKSTIARLIDYCLGGNVEMTPALQSEFASSALHLQIDTLPVTIERAANANQVLVAWGPADKTEQLALPARVPNGVVLPNTQVVVLSDLIFHLAGFQPPKIRRSRDREDSELQRLSFRDLYWYCYLDQDSMDSSFFNLDHDAETFRRLKSRSVLAYLLGFNQQRVAELEAELEDVRSKRTSLKEAAETLEQSLKDAGVESETDIAHRLQVLAGEQTKVETTIANVRYDLTQQKTHTTELLSDRARALTSEISAVRDAVNQIDSSLIQNKRHQNELLSLMTKFQRVTGARAVLDGVEFQRCPRCTQPLPQRGDGACRVCGQQEIGFSESDVTASEADFTTRQKELSEMVEEGQQQLRNLHRRESRLVDEKQQVDQRLTQSLAQYDSLYLSQALQVERRAAAIAEEIRYLNRLKALPARVEQLKRQADSLAKNEVELRRQLKDARIAAEKDVTNMELLKELFLDCLVRSKLAGFRTDDRVSLSAPTFMPEVSSIGSEEVTITSFDTLGSGGKKTLFKCCFALAVHRLARKTESILPSMLVIDSPMKNISERENRTQFEGFHQLLYELAAGELTGTQFILIDKEYCKPEKQYEFVMRERHMTVDKETDPPLIPYYRGK